MSPRSEDSESDERSRDGMTEMSGAAILLTILAAAKQAQMKGKRR